MIQNMTAEEVKAALAAVPETEPDEIEVLEAIKKSHLLAWAWSVYVRAQTFRYLLTLMKSI